VKESENGRLVRFGRGHIVVASLAGASLKISATLLGVSRTTISVVMLACTNPGKIIHQRRGTVGENQL
jgi:hypothetical protein